MNLPRLTLLLLAAVSTASAQTTPSIFPFEPGQMLGALPVAPTGWKMTQSVAETTLGEWLETRATRTFQAVTPPSESAPAATPGEVEITIIDTAGFAPALAAFANFTPGKNGTLEKKLIGSLPALVVVENNGRQFTQLLVSSRYLLEVTLSGLARNHVEDWLRSFRFDVLPRKDVKPATRARQFILTYVDELQPANNRSYAVSTTNAKRVDAFLKTLPQSPSEAEATETTTSAQP